MAVADVNIKGLPKEFMAHSKINEPKNKGASVWKFSYAKNETERTFKNYTESSGALNGRKFPRFHDTEAKILEDIAGRLKNPKIKGTINLYTELPACQSCSNIILEFRKKFPNIKLNIYTK